MAIDRVTIWRTAPSGDIALDNDLFLEAQQSQFLQKDFALTAGVEVQCLKLRVTQPSIVIGSIMLASSANIRFTNLGPVQDPEGFHCTYSAYRDNNTAVENTIVSFADTLLVDSCRAIILCKISPSRNNPYIDMTLAVNSVAANNKLMAGSYLKIL